MINFRALEPRLKLDRAGKIEPISQPAHGHTSAVRVLNLAPDDISSFIPWEMDDERKDLFSRPEPP